MGWNLNLKWLVVDYFQKLGLFGAKKNPRTTKIIPL